MVKQDHPDEAAAATAAAVPDEAAAATAAAVPGSGDAPTDGGGGTGAKRRDAFALHAREDAAEGLRRIARGQVDRAVERLRDARGDELPGAVHDARKRLKRLRALVRLARDELGREVARAENAGFRDAGRQLSGARDATVLLQTLDALTARHADELPPQPFAALRAALVADEADARARIVRDAAAIAAVLAGLQAARLRLAGWPLRADAGTAPLAPGLERIYRRGRKALRKARREPTDETLHELRKRAKDLWHSAEILTPAAPKPMRRLAKRAHRLSDLIGEDHDLAVLRAAGLARPDKLTPGELAQLIDLTRRRQAKLRRKALKRARKLYAAKPRKLARRVAA